MKKLAVVASLFATSAVTSAAFAQPSLAAPIADAPAPEPTRFLSVGLVIGSSDLPGPADDGELLYGAAAFEGGYRVGHSPLWLHGLLAFGGLTEILVTTVDTTFVNARVGVETRACLDDGGVFCVIGGVDVGVRYQMFTGNDGTQNFSLQSTAYEVVPRGGFDIGGDHIRVRPTGELELGADGGGYALSCAIAYLW